MIDQLKQAFELAQHRSEQEQRMLATLLLEEMRAEKQWETLFADPRSNDLLGQLAAEAVAEDDAGDTETIIGETFM